MQNSALPPLLQKHFASVCAIPHGSGNCRALSDYCRNFAEENGCRAKQDEAGNLIVWLEASEGFEDAEPIAVQGHLDMVCDAAENYSGDMAKEGIKIKTDGKFLFADKTTLGADDGIAIAFMLALIEDKTIFHPRLELLFTADEEIGMIGATALDPAPLHAKKLINIDSEEEGILTTSCAGGVRTYAVLPVTKEKLHGVCLRISLAGLRGGHSGVEIGNGRENAVMLLAEILFTVFQKTGFRLVFLQGGKKINIIPSSASALIAIPEEKEEEIQALLQNAAEEVRKRSAEKGFSLSFEKADSEKSCLDENSSRKVLSALCAMPDGVQKMNPCLPDFVQTSLNLGILKTEENKIWFQQLIRSNVNEEKEALSEELEKALSSFGGTIEFSADYPAWEYRKSSPLCRVMSHAYQKLFEKEAVVSSIHAGLECGILAGKIKDLDAVSFGPNILSAHTPQEKLEIESAARMWSFLLEVLKSIK